MKEPERSMWLGLLGRRDVAGERDSRGQTAGFGGARIQLDCACSEPHTVTTVVVEVMLAAAAAAAVNLQ